MLRAFLAGFVLLVLDATAMTSVAASPAHKAKDHVAGTVVWPAGARPVPSFALRDQTGRLITISTCRSSSSVCCQPTTLPPGLEPSLGKRVLRATGTGCSEHDGNLPRSGAPTGFWSRRESSTPLCSIWSICAATCGWRMRFHSFPISSQGAFACSIRSPLAEKHRRGPSWRTS